MKIESHFVVDLCTSSPIPIGGNLSIGNISPIPVSFDDQKHDVSVVDMDISYTTLNSPVVIDGLDIYDDVLLDAVQNRQIPNASADEFIEYSSCDLLEIPELEPNITIGTTTEPPSYVNSSEQVELNPSSKLPGPIICSGSMTISPP